ncbi:RcnB family protein [Sphingomonas crusticola]|uniref:RcnB family protein n=1 Tax=Sphingomonas crusticola TaxID=1697973 RepID=UPI000E269164|nr:RcnB family protein [Sphingomonas crusticola]
MKSVKLALLAAAAVMVVMPAMAQDRDGRHGGRENRSFDSGERNNVRPTPPQAVAPRPQPQVSAPAAPQQQQRGTWGGGNRFSPEQRAQWQAGRGQRERNDARPVPPQANTGTPQQDVGRWSRGENRGDVGRWTGNDRRQRGDRDAGSGRVDTQRDEGRWDRDNRGGAGDWRRNDGNRGNNDRRWDNNNRGNNNDGRWDNNRRNDGRWDRDGRGNGRRPDLNWRNDHRYDWRGWRNTHRDIFRRGHYNAPYGYGYRSVYRGFFLEPFFYASNYWLSDPYEYRLPPVEWPYRWVRYYDDALLVDTTTGEVADVIQGFFY